MSDRTSLIGLGVGAALAVALPASVLAQVLDTSSTGDDPPGAVYLLVLVVLAGVGVGGWVVGRRRPGHPARTGAIVGLAAIAIVQALGVARRIIAGHDVAWGSIPVVLAVATAIGGIAAVLGARPTGRTRP